MRQELELEPRQPTLRRVLVQQLRMIDVAKRAPLLLALIALPTVMWPTTGYLIPIRPMLIAAVAWPLLVWQGEGPGQRTYHRSLPVAQTTHDLLKIGSGAVWLLLTVALTLALLIAYGIMTNTPVRLLGISAPVLINFFSGTLIVYLLVSLFPILTDRPLEWLLGTAVGIAALGNLPQALRGNPISEVLAMVSGGQFGLGVALLGAHLTGERALLMRNYDFRMHFVGPWVISTVLWLAIALGLVVCASRVANARGGESVRSRIGRALAALFPVQHWSRRGA